MNKIIVLLLIVIFPLSVYSKENSIDYNKLHKIVDNGAVLLFSGNEALYKDFTSSLSNEKDILGIIKSIENTNSEYTKDEFYLLGILKLILGKNEEAIGHLKESGKQGFYLSQYTLAMLRSLNIKNVSKDESLYWAFLAFYRNPQPNDISADLIAVFSKNAQDKYLTLDKLKKIESEYISDENIIKLVDNKKRIIPKRERRMKWVIHSFMQFYLGSQIKQVKSTSKKPNNLSDGMTINEVISYNKDLLKNLHIEDAKQFVILSKKDSKNKEHYHADKKNIVPYISVGDTLLLSDRVTHHYTQVYNITDKYVYLVEPKIDNFFLLKGYNLEGISADKEYINGKLAYKVSKDDLKKVCKAIITVRGGEIPMSIGIKLADGELRL